MRDATAEYPPNLTQLDYSEAFGTTYDNISASEFMKMSNHPNRLGGLVDCIHHIGASKFTRNGPDSVTGHHQVRVEYKRFTSMEKKEIEAEGSGLTIMLHTYKKTDGEWKLAIIKPTNRLSAFNYDKIFAEPKRSKM